MADLHRLAAAAAFAALPLAGLWDAVPGATVPGWVWGVAAGGCLLGQRAALGPGARRLLGLFVLVVVAMWAWAGVPPGVALQAAGPIAALLAGLALLGRAAGHSPDITQAARFLAARGARSRYAALSLGTHLFAILLNFGAVLVMTTLLAQGRDRMGPEAVRRATLAILRGFAAMPFWSPLGLSVVVTISIVPGVGYGGIWPWGLGFALAYMAAGFALDSGTAPSDGPEPPAAPAARAALVRVALRAAGLMAGSVALLSAGLSMVGAVLVASLGLAVPWLLVQRGPAAFRPAALSDTARSMANEIAVVGGAALAGAAVVAALAQAGPLFGPLSPAMAAGIAALVPWLVAAAGAVALNPIVAASVILGLLQASWPEAALEWLALAVIFGWGTTAAGTPYTANILIAARVMDRPSPTLAYRDNGVLTLLALTLGGIVAALGVLATA